MQERRHFSGSLVALVTPFNGDAVDTEALERCVDYQLAGGTQGVVVAGTTGEAPVLSKGEYAALVAAVCEQVAGKVPVIAGATSYDPREAVELAALAKQHGADGLLCAAGYYNRPDQEGLYGHLRYLHDHSELPILLYNIPPRTIVDISPDTLARLSELERVVGVKDACRDLARPMEERMRITRCFSFLSGDDCTAVAYNAMGGNGVISVIANVLPQLSRQLQDACRDNDYAAGREFQAAVTPLIEALSLAPNPSAIKYACSLLDLCQPECRLPMVPLSDAAKASIRTAMAPWLMPVSRQSPAKVG
ncbi:dihydrodipicolinate synthase [Alcanivorax nanhaiticus]|uniref:4-hydroxy-tetrahydrodipicolinate synthase n=1 Tax=Alcanivorax nanhaiticus TaxID=1177154 RepID=A0A095UQE6_9GAMM|nr:4-hydroxy-tetrahydrodipicolinate synthase [Alcanivorax nanhaiticus]KGD64765.1 dihydrodipicolinate synthase [Alcanivorax nanhaiticus]